MTLGSLSNHASTTARKSFENVTSRFYGHVSVVPYNCKTGDFTSWKNERGRKRMVVKCLIVIKSHVQSVQNY